MEKTLCKTYHDLLWPLKFALKPQENVKMLKVIG